MGRTFMKIEPFIPLLLMACLGPASSTPETGEEFLAPRDPGPLPEEIVAPDDQLGPDADDPGGLDPGGACGDALPVPDCGPMVCYDCFCEVGGACGGCFDSCHPVPPEVLDCSCCPAPPCEAPSFPEDCSQIPAFPSDLQATCTDGTISVSWQQPWYCEGEKRLTGFTCRHECPWGCQEGVIADWPPDGATLVERWCLECREVGDCEGRPHDLCEGAWQCKEGRCAWACCVSEGGRVPGPVSDRSCCPGLVPVAADWLDEQGACAGFVGAAVCTRCGDRQCGPGENVCNCPEDCSTPMKCVTTRRSSCLGDPYGGQDPAGTLEVQVEGRGGTST